MTRTKRGVCRHCEVDYSHDMKGNFFVNYQYFSQICKPCKRAGLPLILPKWKVEARDMHTYGEAYTQWSCDVNGFEYAFHEVPPLRMHHPRMSYKDAGKYYTEKINKAMGWKHVPRVEFVMHPEPEYDNMDLEGWDTVEQYYDYHSALRLEVQLGYTA